MQQNVSSGDIKMDKYSIWSSGLVFLPLRVHGSQKKTFWITDFWINSVIKISRLSLFTLIFCFLFSNNWLIVNANDAPDDIPNYDAHGKHVNYYPHALMISYNPQAVVSIKIRNYLTSMLIYVLLVLDKISMSMIPVLQSRLCS